MKKKILYFIPTIILALYLLIYIPLFKYITNIYLSKEIFPAVANDTMFKINIVIIVIATIMKLLLKSNSCNIKRFIGIFNIVIFIMLCLAVVLFGVIFTWA